MQSLREEQVRCLLVALEEELSSVDTLLDSPTSEAGSAFHEHELRELISLFRDIPEVWVK